MGAKLVRKGSYSIREIELILKDFVLQRLNETKSGLKGQQAAKATIGGQEIYALSDRYKLFFTKGYKCVECGIEGKFFALEHGRGSDLEICHLNLYAYDGNGEEVLMTKDHIIPKAQGGKNHLDNYQVMCEQCNSAKSKTDALPRE